MKVHLHRSTPRVILCAVLALAASPWAGAHDGGHHHGHHHERPCDGQGPGVRHCGDGGAEVMQGRAVFRRHCGTCHAHGTAGAPVLGDAEAWTGRAAQGMDRLVERVIGGLGAMPPRGGHPRLGDDAIRRAVAFMLWRAGVTASGAPGH